MDKGRAVSHAETHNTVNVFLNEVLVIFLLFAGTAIISSAQTFTTIYNFNTNSLFGSYAGLVQATDGNFYGASYYGAANNGGSVFRITPSGTLTTIYNFCSQPKCTDGDGPNPGLIQATDGNFYGTTNGGGVYGYGTVFKMTAAGKLTTLYSFDCTQIPCAAGFSPMAGLVQAADGNFFGTTLSGGNFNSDCVNNGFYAGCGTVFEITPKGKLTTLHTFSYGDGDNPSAALIQVSGGSLFGTTYFGGTNGWGTIFKIAPTGVFTSLYSFCSQSNCTDGSNPVAPLVQAADLNLYGTSSQNGVTLSGDNGTVFMITPSGTLTTLYNFCSLSGCADGFGPAAALVQGTDGNFYSTTQYGGTSTCKAPGCGTIFSITPGGVLTTLHNFCTVSGCPDGLSPDGLIQDTNGNFYGITYDGGANNEGTAYSLSVGLGPFVEAQTASGKVGATVKILGTGLTGASEVYFNGKAATTFKVVSSSLIEATVPAGATTGYITVTTPSGTLISNMWFQINP
jgi:uncharacterized repeat protein (TIGR03803 family)